MATLCDENVAVATRSHIYVFGGNGDLQRRTPALSRYSTRCINTEKTNVIDRPLTVCSLLFAIYT